MRRRRFAVCRVFVLVSGTALGAAPAPMTIEIATPRTAYLLGEPVILDVTVRNVSGHKLRAVRTLPIYARILVGPEGRGMTQIEQETTHREIVPLRKPLEPDGTWTCQLRALYHIGPDSLREDRIPPDLALPKPGAYTLQVEVPMIGVVVEGSPTGVGSRYILSNPIRVEVRAPQGDDEVVFRALRDWEVMHLLRIGEPYDSRRRAAVLTVAGLLRDHPKSGYRECLRWALRTYFDSPQGLFKPEEQERFRELLEEPVE